MKEIYINPENLTAEITYTQTKTDESGIIVDTIIIPVIYSQEQFDTENITRIDYYINEHIKDDNIKIYEDLCYSVGKINRLAEVNFDRLRRLINQYFLNRKYKSFFRKRDKATQEIAKYNVLHNFNKLTFRQLFNILKYIIENDRKFQSIAEFETLEKREAFFEYYDRFIANRNIFTHGIIFISLPDMKIMCRAIVNNSEVYREIDENSIVSTHQVYHLLDRVIGQMLEKLI
ncbi:hypothetical protein [Flectobacillus roseus]|uniref:Apea-like HEPN domain-containing protein n=1 Tax=Flectobacillus roseus TaxID=502259 RepID=A0ABT6Y8S2_9BACT|nr:hypothetical protein [Flectobacillus roseus]MDI9859869.1 hypothetical protein [Flectobacillus roseus]